MKCLYCNTEFPCKHPKDHLTWCFAYLEHRKKLKENRTKRLNPKAKDETDFLEPILGI